MPEDFFLFVAFFTNKLKKLITWKKMDTQGKFLNVQAANGQHLKQLYTPPPSSWIFPSDSLNQPLYKNS